MEKGLLEWLVAQVGCAYISILREPEYGSKIARQAAMLSLEAYSEREWCDAASYLATAENSFRDAVSARNYLVGLARV